VRVQVRHRAAHGGEIIRLDGDEIELASTTPSPPSPGQSLVLYDGSRVLGGNFIERAAGARPAPEPSPPNASPAPQASAWGEE
jgi:hypothetical protein